CDRCEVVDDMYNCGDCLHHVLLCKSCLFTEHAMLPSHRFRKWTGTHFERVRLDLIGFVFHLGHGGRPCTLGHNRKFTLGDVNGIHELHIRFCRCPGHASGSVQLLRARIYPCSDERPESGFTFNMLRDYHLSFAEAKLSSQRYYNVRVHHSNTVFPLRVDDRYREFGRVARQWAHLQDLKRAGQFVISEQPPVAGDLALRCPACPRLNFNYVAQDAPVERSYLYVQHMSYDGSFQMVRKNKAFDQWDICLSEGRKYFAPIEQFQAHLERADTKLDKFSHRNVLCNNHKAADHSLVKFSGLAETGIGSTLCARHSFCLPAATVSFTKGERFAYTDFAIASAMRLFLSEGTRSLGVHYDIMCHYDKHLWERLELMGNPIGPISRGDLESFIGAVPKFHLAGH
ncbi:hypothetical protein BDV93DRAFT_422934, partial [Ceratobasidium sp. AG-I]